MRARKIFGFLCFLLRGFCVFEFSKICKILTENSKIDVIFEPFNRNNFLLLQWIKGYLNSIPCKNGCCRLNYMEAHQLLSLNFFQFLVDFWLFWQGCKISKLPVYRAYCKGNFFITCNG